MKFVALFALVCLSTSTLADKLNVDHATSVEFDDPLPQFPFDLQKLKDLLGAKVPQRVARAAPELPATNDETLEEARELPEDVEVPNDNKPHKPTREEELGLDSDVRLEDAREESRHESHTGERRHGNGLGGERDIPVVTTDLSATSTAKDSTEVSVDTTARPEVTSSAGRGSDATTAASSTDVTKSADVSSTTAASSSDASTASSGSDASTATSAGGETTVTDSTATGTDSTATGTDSTVTDSTGTESTETEPSTTEAEGDGVPPSKKLSAASISAIVIGGVLALAVVVAIGMAIVRRRQHSKSPERRGILDA